MKVRPSVKKMCAKCKIIRRGDDLLKYVAKRMFDMSRESDVVARFAGDEFVFILPETPAKNAEKLMKRIKKYLKDNPLKNENLTIPVSISFGVASTEDAQINDPSALLKRADEMLYQAKQEKQST